MLFRVGNVEILLLHVMLAILVLAFLVFVWAQYRREQLEQYIREILRRRYKD